MRNTRTAAALLELVDRSRTSGRPGADHELSEVLADALDRYELARLYCVASARLGRSGPDPWHYCPWCQSEFEDAGFAAHLAAAHARMLEA